MADVSKDLQADESVALHENALEPIVTAAWLVNRIDQPDLRVIDATVHMSEHDVRSGRDDWYRAHIPGSVFVDLIGELAVHDPYPMAIPPGEQFAASMGALGIGDGHTVIVYDNASNMWAARLWWMLRTYGADRVAVLDGGMRAWVEHGGAVSPQPCTYEPATFTIRRRNETIVHRAEVVDALRDEDITIVDALDAAHYRGERADYGRRGHLPGAVNVPAEELVDPSTGRYLPVERLRERLERVLAAPRVVTYCGAGVGAASDALVLTALGHDNVAVYDGSLLEWASNPDLPLKTSTDQGTVAAPDPCTGPSDPSPT